MDQALYAVIMEAYINGVSTRKVDALVSALGSQSGISKSQVSRICQEIDQQVQAFLSWRPPEWCKSPGTPTTVPPGWAADPRRLAPADVARCRQALPTLNRPTLKRSTRPG